MKLSEKEIKIIIDSLQFENFSDTKTEDRVKLLNRFRKKLKSDLLHPVSNPLYEFDRFVHKNYPNDYYVVSTLMDLFGERNDC